MLLFYLIHQLAETVLRLFWCVERVCCLNRESEGGPLLDERIRNEEYIAIKTTNNFSADTQSDSYTVVIHVFGFSEALTELKNFVLVLVSDTNPSV
jgi:hypothetical protein